MNQQQVIDYMKGSSVFQAVRSCSVGHTAHRDSLGQPRKASADAEPHSARLCHISMNLTPRLWITVGWMFIAATAGLVIVAIVQVLSVANYTCVQPLATNEFVHFTCSGSGAEFVRGLICAVLAGVAFFSGLSCFFWAAHLRSLRPMPLSLS
jgi:hypothetical protein